MDSNVSGIILDNLKNFKFIFRTLQYRNYRLFFIGQFISLIGTWMQQIAVSWLVYQMTHSVFLLGLVGFVSQFPTSCNYPFCRRVVGSLQSLPDAHYDPNTIHDPGNNLGDPCFIRRHFCLANNFIELVYRLCKRDRYAHQTIICHLYD